MSDYIIRPMVEMDMANIRTLYAHAHPDWPERSERWWYAHPTLVLEEDDFGVIGMTSYSVSIAPSPEMAHLFRHDRAEVGWGYGVAVAPHRRGEGWGTKLCQARFDVFRELEIGFFLGLTQPENEPMQAIFKRQGLAKGPSIPGAYPAGETAVMWTGRVR